MTLQIFSYEYFIQKSMELKREEYMLPECSQTLFDKVKKKLNIRKEITKEYSIKPTTLGKQEEVIATLFKLFNKITEKTYDKLSVEIFLLISHNISDSEKVCTNFFRVILNNSFFCHLYAKLYKGFILIINDFSDVLDTHISSYVNEITNIVYISPNEDYDKYCDYVKSVESVKNFTSFLIQCLKQEVLQSGVLLDLAITFQTYSINGIDSEEKLLLNEIYISNILIIVRDTYNEIRKNDGWYTFVTNHNLLTESRGCGKNRRINFNLLDISELIDTR